MTCPRHSVGYIFCDDSTSSDTPETAGRAAMVHSLVDALGLLDKVTIVERARRASRDDVCRFHSSEYVDLLLRVDDEDGIEEVNDEVLDAHGLAYDADWFPGVWRHASMIAGGSLRAADLLSSGACTRSIFWQGGRHHASVDRASGFCYVNDVVLATLRLLKRFDAVIVVDLDVHHGDGTERAFADSEKVLTCSFHHRAPGFFPGTGDVRDCGRGRGRGSTVNVPLRAGLRSHTFARLFRRVAQLLRSWAQCRSSTAVVVQCGADCLAGDPRGAFELEPAALANAVGVLLDWDMPTLLLGGGGYKSHSAASAWALITMRALGAQLPAEIDIPSGVIGWEHYRDGGFVLRGALAEVGAPRCAPKEEPSPKRRRTCAELRAARCNIGEAAAGFEHESDGLAAESDVESDCSPSDAHAGDANDSAYIEELLSAIRTQLSLC